MTDTGNVPAEVLGQRLTTDATAYVRAVVNVANGGFPWVETFEAVIGAKPDGWQPETWSYPSVLFLATECQAQDLRPLIASRDEPAQTIQVAGLQLLARPVHQQVQWWHRPSRGQHDVPMLRWPTWDYEVSLATATSNNGDPTSGGFLIGDGPPFPMFSNAYRAFFTGNFASVGASNPLRYGRFRFAETDAWINRVHVTTSHMDVTVSGSSPIGVTVDLIAPTNQTAKAIGKSGRVRLALRRPLGSDAWLYLTRGSEWLDYRAINANFIGADIQAMQGVEISTEPAAALEALISGGEGGQVEFKYRLPVADKEKARFLSSVAAFANTSGGTIVFGIDPDEVTVVGLTMTDVPAERDRLLNIIRTGLTESPPVDGPVEQEVDGKQVMVMVVDPGPAVPYGVIFQQNRGEHPKYFVRSGANNFPATPADIRATVAARTQSNDRAFGRFMQ